MPTKALRSFLFILLLLGFLYYARQYIEATSTTVNGEKYYVLFDDAMISMRYAYNLAHGNGLVWNPGERVEGFTNPLWVGFMALFHLIPLSASKISLYIQWSGAVFLAGTLYFAYKLIEEFTEDLIPMLAAVALTAFYSPLISWSLLGVEVSILCLLLTGALWMMIRAGASGFSPWPYVLLGVSTLVRMDMAVPLIVILAAMFLADKAHRRQHVLWGLGVLALSLGGQTLGRYLYYGELLPNTYFLKVEGWPFSLRIMRGMYALIWFAYYNSWPFMLLPFTLLIFRRDWKILLLLLVLLGQMAYSVYVGGDAWEHHGGANRYISIAMPVFFVVFALSIHILLKAAMEKVGSRWETRLGAGLIYIFIFAIAMVNFNLLQGDWKYIERWQFDRKPDYVAGNERNLEIALALQSTTRPGTSVAVIGAGTIPYFLPGHYAIDILGKMDPVVARGPVRTSMGIPDVPFMRPGHMKWNYAYTIGELRPDVIVSLWPGTKDEAEPYLLDYVSAAVGEKINVFLLRDSPNVLWDRVIVHD